MTTDLSAGANDELAHSMSHEEFSFRSILGKVMPTNREQASSKWQLIPNR